MTEAVPRPSARTALLAVIVGLASAGLLGGTLVAADPGARRRPPPTQAPSTTAPPTSSTAVPTTAVTTTVPPTTTTTVALEEGSVGILRIPRLGLDRAVFEGVEPDQLDRGPGHQPGSALLGESGNVVIAGHRTTHGAPFYHLDALQPGDEIVLVDRFGPLVYRVRETRIASLDEVELLGPTPDDRVTLYACHPPGSDRQRIVVIAGFAEVPTAPA